MSWEWKFSMSWKLIGSTFLSLSSSLHWQSDVTWGMRWDERGGERGEGVNGNRKDETESRSPPPLLSSCVTFQAWGDVFQSMVKCTLFKCWWRNFQWKNRKDETRSRSTLNPLFFLKHIPGQGKNPFHRKRENQHLYNEHLTIDWKASLNFNNSLHHWSS